MWKTKRGGEGEGGRAEIDLLGLNKGLKFYEEKFFEKLVEEIVLEQCGWVIAIYFSVRIAVK